MVWLWLLACTLAPVDESEWMPGGETTNTLLLGSNAFSMPAANLDDATEQDFYSGNSFFKQSWVEASASTEARDGLGPLFNARSCSGCHQEDGRGAPPDDGRAPFVGVLLRLSLPDGSPDPVYGGQLQDQANPGLEPEALPTITLTEVEGQYDDGTPYVLMAPSYELTELAWGEADPELLISPRVAPQMPGLGLLEAIDEADILAGEDPDDADGDGISGRAQWSVDELGEVQLGRFGWKGDAATLLVQSAAAFAGDLGLTTWVHPEDDCTAAQQACLDEPSGGDPEVSDDILELVVTYSQTLAPAVRRAADDPDIRHGKWLFADIGCTGCHTPSFTTGSHDIEALEGQRIWPWTDLLLHDMGEGLADGRPLGEASGQEWRTPPLWGVGLVEDVSGHTRFLHDGRARTLEEAILWHGGEAEAARDGFLALEYEDRAALLAFVEDL